MRGAVVVVLLVVGLPLAGCSTTAGDSSVATGELDQPELVADPSRNVVRIGGEACGLRVIGGGVVVGPDLVLTSAHVVAGAKSIDVAEPEQEQADPAELIAFDSNRDLALLRTVGLRQETAVIGQGAPGDTGDLLVVDGDGSIEHRPYEIRRSIRATGEDIYREQGADRRAFEVDLVVDPGESGSGLFDESGRLIGIAFASSRQQDATTYAVADDEIAKFLAEAGSEPIETGRCPP